MQTVYIMVGPTGSGKTRHAELLAKNTGAVRIGTDSYRGKKLNEAVAQALAAGQSVIVNGTHPKQSRRQDFADIARQYGAKTRCIRLDANKKTAAKRSRLASAAQRYTVAGKFFQNFEQLGTECDEKEIIPVDPIVNNKRVNNKPSLPTTTKRPSNLTWSNEQLRAAQNLNGRQHLFIMMGPSGAGKSTYAQRLAALTGSVIVSSDVYKSSRPKIDKAVKEALTSGKSVIVNATHPSRERREQLARIARQSGIATRCIHRDVNKKTAEGRSKLKDPIVYFASSKYWKAFEAPGNECDKVYVVTNANKKNSSKPTSSAPLKKTKLVHNTSGVNTSLGAPSLNTSLNTSVNTTLGASSAKSNSTKVNSTMLATPMPTLAAPMPMLAEKYDPRSHTGSFYASEKLDGIRALAVDGTLYTRAGNVIAAPSWFLRLIPPGTYDGELYAGRGQFNVVSSTVMKKKPVDDEWKRIQYRIFDDHASTTSYKNTLTALRKQLPACDAGNQVCVIDQRLVSNHNTISKFHQNVKNKGGEGLMLRRNVPYVKSRSTSILKVKSHIEQEAVVIGFNPKPDGSVKSFQMKFVNGQHVGVQFNLAVQSEAKKSQIKMGDILTVQFAEYTKTGKPRFPVFKGVRTNISTRSYTL